MPEHQRHLDVTAPGEEALPYTNRPMRAIKVPDDEGLPYTTEGPQRPSSAGAIIGEVQDEPKTAEGDATPMPAPSPQKTFDAKKMHVLVAEDDPINSKIVKKRMENKGHIVHLTTNGEECAGAYQENSGAYDLVLMDMQVSLAFHE